MQPLQSATNQAARPGRWPPRPSRCEASRRRRDRRRGRPAADDAARAVQHLEVIPRVLCRLRNDARAEHSGLTVPQFRILARISREAETVSSLAEQQGVSLSAMSRMVETLARKGLLTRQAAVDDRRRVMLQPTARGRAQFESIRRLTQDRLADRIRQLPAASQRALADGLAVLERLFP